MDALTKKKSEKKESLSQKQQQRREILTLSCFKNLSARYETPAYGNIEKNKPSRQKQK